MCARSEVSEVPTGGRWEGTLIWENERNLQPLIAALVDSYIQFLPKQTYPIRTGVHPNTAFGLAFAFDYAKASGNEKLAALIENQEQARAKNLSRK